MTDPIPSRAAGIVLRITATFEFHPDTDPHHVDRIADVVRELGERVYYREIPTGIQPPVVSVDEVLA